MKTVGLLSRRGDLTREAFRTYYETRHAVLGMTHFPFTKYVRNHLVTASREIDFDCISEFWVDDLANTHAILSSPIGDMFREDEQRFMDRALIRSGLSDERLLFGPPRGVDEASTRRRFFCFRGPAGVERQAFLEAVASAGRLLPELLPGVTRVALDATSPFPGEGAFVFDGWLSVWLADHPSELRPVTWPADVAPALDVLTDVCESTPDALAAHYASQRA